MVYLTSKRSQRAFKWNKENPERRKEIVLRYRAKDPIRHLLHSSKYNAKAKGLEWSLSRDDFIIPEVCPVFGTPFEAGTKYALSIDRIDSSKGYVKGNIQLISILANAMKRDATEEQLKQFANWILTK